MKITSLHASGKATIRVWRKGKVILEYKDVPNLLMNTCFDPWARSVANNNNPIRFHTYTDSTPNFQDLDGTWSVAPGSAVLNRVSGTGVFQTGATWPNGCVGSEIKFADGTRAHVVTFTSGTQVTLSRVFPAGVAAQTLRRYRTNFGNPTATQTSGITNNPAATVDISAGTWEKTYSALLPSATSNYSVQSFGVAATLAGTPRMARLLPPSPIALETDDQLEVNYTQKMTLGGRATRTIPLSSVVTGWPVRYAATSITGNGTSITVTAAGHNFLAGDQVSVEVVPLRRAIVNITSVIAGIWTVNSVGHGRTAGQEVTIENSANPSYNVTRVIDTVVDADNFTIDDGTNPGTSAGGTQRLKTPTPWYAGLWTVASISGSNVLITSSVNSAVALDYPTAILTSPDECQYTVNGGFEGMNVVLSAYMYEAANAAAPLPLANIGRAAFFTGAINTFTFAKNQDSDYTNDFISTFAQGTPWNAGGTAYQRIKEIFRGNNLTGCTHHQVLLTTPQPKLTTHRLTMPVFREQIFRELP